MAGIECLIEAYQAYVRLPWNQTLGGSERVWFAIYEPAQERRLRLRVDQFALATREAGHGWRLVDLTSAFADWMAQHEYREAYFEAPDDMDLALAEFKEQVIERLQAILADSGSDANSVVAVEGIASLFGFLRVSELLNSAATEIRGRLLVFFPGERDGSNFRLLDARDGWNYLAVPIQCAGG